MYTYLLLEGCNVSIIFGDTDGDIAWAWTCEWTWELELDPRNAPLKNTFTYSSFLLSLSTDSDVQQKHRSKVGRRLQKEMIISKYCKELKNHDRKSQKQVVKKEEEKIKIKLFQHLTKWSFGGESVKQKRSSKSSVRISFYRITRKANSKFECLTDE